MSLVLLPLFSLPDRNSISTSFLRFTSNAKVAAIYTKKSAGKKDFSLLLRKNRARFPTHLADLSNCSEMDKGELAHFEVRFCIFCGI